MKKNRLLLSIFLSLFVLGTVYAFTGIGQKETVKKPDTLYWFNVDGSGNPTTVIGTDPSMVCPDQSGDLCAKAYNESQTSGSGNNRVVISTEVTHYQSEAFRLLPHK